MARPLIFRPQPRAISFDESPGQSERAAEARFPARHLALIVFVIIAGKMQDRVQHQDLDLGGERVAEETGMVGRQVRRNGHIAGQAIDQAGHGRKRQDVGRAIFPAETQVQGLQLAIAGDEHIDRARQPGSAARARDKPGQRGLA